MQISSDFYDMAKNNPDPDNVAFAACDYTSRSPEVVAVKEFCNCQKIPYFAVFRHGALVSGIQSSSIGSVKDFIATTVAENSLGGFGDDDEDF